MEVKVLSYIFIYIEKNSIWGAEQMHAHMFRNPEGAEEGRRGEAGRHEDMGRSRWGKGREGENKERDILFKGAI